MIWNSLFFKITKFPLFMYIALSVYSINPKTSLDKNTFSWPTPIISGSWNLAAASSPFSNIATNA